MYTPANWRTAEMVWSNYSPANWRTAEMVRSNYSSANWRTAEMVCSNYSPANWRTAEMVLVVETGKDPSRLTDLRVARDSSIELVCLLAFGTVDCIVGA